jgi:NTE family protein
LYDNLPTDYFDRDDASLFIKNLKPHQTMVLAFGDHIEESKNLVFQALYRSRWDEVVSEALLEKIVELGIQQAKHNFSCASELNEFENQAEMVVDAIQCILEQRVRQEKMPREEAQMINGAVQKALRSLPTDYQHHSAWSEKYTFEHHAHEIAQLIKEKMRPLLFDVGVISRLSYNIFLETFGGLHLQYSYVKQNDAGYQKLRSDYPLRTVELRVGNLSTFDFDDATQFARVLDAFGYLDTINFITNHDLQHESRFNESQFYVDLMHSFECIHQAVLQGAGKNSQLNEVTQEIHSLRQQLTLLGKSEAVICRQLYYFVKSMAEKSLDSIEAFALSRAVEFHNHTIDPDKLFKEVYEEGFKHSGLFSTSHITGERFFRLNTLHETLKNKQMKALYPHRLTDNEDSRADRVFDALSKIDTFQLFCPQ